jgi:hypothetical protein
MPGTNYKPGDICDMCDACARDATIVNIVTWEQYCGLCAFDLAIGPTDDWRDMDEDVPDVG